MIVNDLANNTKLWIFVYDLIKNIFSELYKIFDRMKYINI